MAQKVLYVDPSRGSDRQDGRSLEHSLKTIGAALRLCQEPTLIRLAPGEYTSASGEQFPLRVPFGCTLEGGTQGGRPSAVVRGGGVVEHPLLGIRPVACILAEDATLKSLRLSNPQERGTGVWMAAGRPQMVRVFVQQCGHYGAIALDEGLPIVQNCVFESCGLAGVALFTHSKGQFERVFCRNNRAGFLLQDASAPLVKSCTLDRNQVGMEITGTASPVLRDNRIQNNRQYGLYLRGKGTADLGHPQDEGRNQIRSNGQADIVNETGRSLPSCGNDLLPQWLRGPVELMASQLPDPAAVPPTLLDQPASFPDENGGKSPDVFGEERQPSRSPAGGSRFQDMAGHWSTPFVNGLVNAGVVAGFPDGTYRPEQGVTRAEFAAFVMAAFPDRPIRKSPVPFSDVPADYWASEVLRQAQMTGFLTGFPDGTLRPTQSINRTQAMVAVTNGLGLTGGRVDDLGIYRDRAQIPSYAVDALSTATQRRLVVNYPDPLRLRPLETITRGELSALIYQGRVAIGQSEAIASPYIVQPDSSQPLFADLSGHWARDFIRGLAEINLVSGREDGQFAPDEAISRAAFAALIAKAFQPSPVRPAKSFVDVPAQFWGAEAIQEAYRGNFLSGFPDQTFAPNHPLLRVQIWVAIVNGLYGSTLNVDARQREQFSDYPTVPEYALQQTEIALQKRLITVDPGDNRLRPNRVASRAEACVGVYQALADQGRVEPIASSYLA